MIIQISKSKRIEGKNVKRKQESGRKKKVNKWYLPVKILCWLDEGLVNVLEKGFRSVG